nr:hypothetical protein Itr_chr06CG13510 [Ipomoea trifida]
MEVKKKGAQYCKRDLGLFEEERTLRHSPSQTLFSSTLRLCLTPSLSRSESPRLNRSLGTEPSTPLDRKSKSSPLAVSPVGVQALTASLPSPESPLTVSRRLTAQSHTLTGHCFGLGSSVSQVKVSCIVIVFSRFHLRLSRIQSLIVQIPYKSRSQAP